MKRIFVAFPPGSVGNNENHTQGRSGRAADYPVIAASAATLLKAKGFDVTWVDAGMEGWSHSNFIKYTKNKKPDLIAIQTTTPLVKQDWQTINYLKAEVAEPRNLKVVLMGDHVTALPEESFANSQVDFILTGGDFDFLLLNLCSQLAVSAKGDKPKFEPGIWYRDGRDIVNTGRFKLNHNLNRLPFIDRELTKWQLYKKASRLTIFTMAARACGWGQNSLLSQSVLYPERRPHLRSSSNLLNEIGLLINKYHVDEVIDVSSVFPCGSWLRGFCEGMISRGYHQRVKLGCNARVGSLSGEDWQLMRRAGFRRIFFTEEQVFEEVPTAAGGDDTNKAPILAVFQGNLAKKRLFRDIRAAKRAGLETYLTLSFGYPWESKTDAYRKADGARQLLINGWVDSINGNIVTPYPGSKFFRVCGEQGWLRNRQWDLYNSQRIVLNNALPDENLYHLVENFSRSSYHPKLLTRKIAADWLGKARFLFPRLARNVMWLFSLRAGRSISKKEQEVFDVEKKIKRLT